MKKLKENKKIWIILFCFVTAFLVLLITSKNSPLYPMNDWVDAQAFFTVGKSMLRGIVPYRDLFEQKGPLLYLIYGIGSLISFKTFIGIFLLETVSFTIFLYYCHKIIKLFTEEKYSSVILPIISVVLCTATAFAHGGSAEEFCFPFLSFTLYTFLRYLKGEKLTGRDYLINGGIAGAILMIKYTFLGLWFGFMFFIAIDLFFHKKAKEMFLRSFQFLLGMSIIPLLFTIYFLINQGLGDFIHVYFYINIFTYADQALPFVYKIWNAFIIFIHEITRGGIVLFLLYVEIFVFIRTSSLSKQGKNYLLGTILCAMLGVYIGNTHFVYYLLILLPFIILSFIGLCIYFKKPLDLLFKAKHFFVYYIPFYVIIILLSFLGGNHVSDMSTKKEDLVQYKIAKIIKKEKDQTLLNFGALDWGFYTTTETMPSIRHFEKQNLNYEAYPDNYNAQISYIRDKKVNFVIILNIGKQETGFKINQYLHKNYILISSDEQFFENIPHRIDLWKRK